jgi:hypothetical protein
MKTIFLMFFIPVFTGFKAYAQPVVTVRCANPQYVCATQTYSVDVEFKSNSAGTVLFGMNVRFFYADTVLEFLSFGDFQGGYGPASSDPPFITTSSPDGGPANFGFEGPAEFINGAIQLINQYSPVELSTTGWTKLFNIRFHVDQPVPYDNQGNFCPSIIWDLNEQATGGIGPGIIITIVNGTGSSGAVENCVQFNWTYDAIPGLPYGYPAMTAGGCVFDHTPPSLSCPGPLSAVCSAPAAYTYDQFLAAVGTVTDECCGINTAAFSYTETSTGFFPETITRTYQVCDFCGNTATCTQVITVYSNCSYYLPIWNGNPYQPMNIIITSATLDGQDLEPGDEIGVFDTDENGQFICIGAQMLTNIISGSNPLVIMASTDDPTTPGIQDGFIPGHQIIFRYRDTSEDEEIILIHAAYNITLNQVYTSAGVASVVLTGASVLTWTGVVNDDWDNPANWDFTVIPTSAIKVKIPTTPVGSHFPRVYSINAQCKDLLINPGAYLIITGQLNAGD